LDKKQEILEAAFDLFCAKGYHLSVSELASAVGIKTPSLYSHYTSKDQILELMIRQEIQRYYACLKQTMLHAENLNCKQTMKSLVDFVLEYFSEYKRLRFWRTIPLIPNEYLRNVFSELIADQDSIYTEKMRQCFQRGIENGEIRPNVSESALYLYLSMIQGVMDGMLLYPRNPSENSFAQKVFEAYWDGIGATHPGRKGNEGTQDTGKS